MTFPHVGPKPLKTVCGRCGAPIAHGRFCQPCWQIERVPIQRAKRAAARQIVRQEREPRIWILAGPTLDLVEAYGAPRLTRLMSKKFGPRPESYRRVFERAKQRGTISLDMADKVCIALGSHLSRVDPFYWEAA